MDLKPGGALHPPEFNFDILRGTSPFAEYVRRPVIRPRHSPKGVYWPVHAEPAWRSSLPPSPSPRTRVTYRLMTFFPSFPFRSSFDPSNARALVL